MTAFAMLIGHHPQPQDIEYFLQCGGDSNYK
jgi:hypothetical protein